MTIVNFTPISAAIGGALIGLSATLLMLLTGRILGVSHILAGLLPQGARDLDWRIAFFAGLLLAPLLGGLGGFALAAPVMDASWAVVIGGGLLIGFGTRLGGGCTSGHGICGIARLSPRSIVATLVFTAVAIAVVAIRRHVIGG
jgi:uncharacterized membrane protein YedE/YeeE